MRFPQTFWTPISLFVYCLILVPTIAEAGDTRPRPAWVTSRIHGSPLPPAPYKIVPVFPGVRFEKPSCIEEVPGSDRLLVTEIEGKVFTFSKRPDVEQRDLVVDLQKVLASSLAGRGVSLFDAEFHPAFLENRYLFLSYRHPDDGVHISRFTLANDALRVLDESEQILLSFDSAGHNGGCLEFGVDGYLYISTGDGDWPNPPDGRTTGQDVSDLLGSVLRIDVDHPSGDLPYSVPSDNPFVELAGARPEIWSYGLRNPWKFGIDREQGTIFAGDNGWETWESVHRIVRGGNSGWPIMEGRAVLRAEVTPGPTPILPPVKDHSHTEANSVIGGPVYRGEKLRDLDGAFVYGDYITGTIWALRPDRDGAYSNSTLVDTHLRISAFTEGSEGELFVLDYDFTGQIYELLPAGLQDTSAEFPRRLSETGLFASLKDLQPAAGVVPYDVTVNRWMDGATALRWVAVPGDGTIQLRDGDSSATYPEGTVFAKQLLLPQRNSESPIRLETQILHYENGEWQPYSYLWDDSGNDAHLVESIGTNRPLEVTDRTGTKVERTWHISATNECKLCHNAGSRFVLGFSPHQLNTGEQLSALASQRAIEQTPSILAGDPSTLVDPHDASQSLEDRARSYLHGNCAMCHHPGGSAIVSFYLRRDLPLSKLNTNKGTNIGTFGMQHVKIIVPGDPYRSVLFYRMSKLGYARMPYIGSRVVDSAGIALIEEWIRSLPYGESNPKSGPAREDSQETAALRMLTTNPATSDREPKIRKLAASTEGTLALVAQMHRGSLATKDFSTALALGREASSDTRGLFEAFVPESDRQAVLGARFSPDAILSLEGNRDRGKLIFFSDAARCRACHEFDDPSKSVGPTLADINKKYPRRSEMLQHVIQPSLKVDDPFAAYIVVTNDGRVFTGLVTKKTDTVVVVKTADKQLVTIPNGEIDEMRKSNQSLMPERMLSDLTAQEAADLLSYLRAP
jgi:putative heme-binding domain-containing protein